MFSNNTVMLTDEVSFSSRFKVENLDEMHYILGMCVKRDHKSTKVLRRNLKEI